MFGGGHDVFSEALHAGDRHIMRHGRNLEHTEKIKQLLNVPWTVMIWNVSVGLQF